LTLLVGQQEGHPACKKRVVGCWCGYVSGSGTKYAGLHTWWLGSWLVLRKQNTQKKKNKH